jgi:hypothetical protein
MFYKLLILWDKYISVIFPHSINENDLTVNCFCFPENLVFWIAKLIVNRYRKLKVAKKITGRGKGIESCV